jgi:P-type Ca2+ transporter type 2C
VSKDPAALASPDVPLGDRADMPFQNTSLTRGTGAMLVTATGMQIEMGRIATPATRAWARRGCACSRSPPG